MVIRKTDKMHELFGKSEQDQCKDCMHLIRNGYNKCAIYGVTHSEATDWKQKNTACGLFNKAFVSDVPIVRLVTPVKEDAQIEGQMNLFGDNNGK